MCLLFFSDSCPHPCPLKDLTLIPAPSGATYLLTLPATNVTWCTCVLYYCDSHTVFWRETATPCVFLLFPHRYATFWSRGVGLVLSRPLDEPLILPDFWARTVTGWSIRFAYLHGRAAVTKSRSTCTLHFYTYVLTSVITPQYAYISYVD